MRALLVWRQTERDHADLSRTGFEPVGFDLAAVAEVKSRQAEAYPTNP